EGGRAAARGALVEVAGGALSWQAYRQAAGGGAERLVGRRGEGGGGHERVRIGDRQGGYPLRGPLPVPRLARGVLSGGGARRARRRAGAMRDPVSRGGPGDPGILPGGEVS